MNSQSPIIEPAELIRLGQSKDVVLIDARSGPDAQERYISGHLPGAIHVDLDKDLSQKPKDPAHGGRHPLPDVKSFGELLGKLGITPEAHVVVYDDKKGANAAARFWWMLKTQGHKNIQVLDGGLEAAVNAGIELSKEPAVVKETAPYPVKEWNNIAGIEQVAAVSTDPDYLIIDVREAYRYRGESEPIDTVAGHIPGAVNIPFASNLDEKGNFKPANELADKYEAIIKDRKPENVIVHCGSGVTACHTLLALEQAGIKGAKLYVGSWSEWSRTGRPVVTEK